MTGSDGQYKLDYLPKGQAATVTFYKEGYIDLKYDLDSEYMSEDHFDCDVEIDEATKLSIGGHEYHKTFYCVYFEAGIEKYHEETIKFEKLISVGSKITCSIDGDITIFNEDYDTKTVIKPVPVDGYRFEQFILNGIPLYAGHEFIVDKVMNLTGSVSYVPITPVPTPTPEDVNTATVGENIVATSDNVPLSSLIIMFFIATTSLIVVRKYLY